MRSIDVLIVGGGINGAAVARDAAGRGFSVMLAERGDYAGATSSASSNLIHGGLRYLEQFAFSLVRKSLHERAVLLEIAPHLVRPMRFLVPCRRGGQRAAWRVRAGLALYDVLAGSRRIARSGALSRTEIDAVPRLRRDDLAAVLHYRDCMTDDARLVLATLLDARARGADIANRREVAQIARADDGFTVTGAERGGRWQVRTRFVVNAAGPWTNDVVGLSDQTSPSHALRLVRGSHIVLKMPQPGIDDAFTLQMDDGRVVFTLPWQTGRYLVIGTTDVPHEGDCDDIVISAAERTYLLAAYNAFFAHPRGPATDNDIVWTWSGVRPLVDDGEADPSKVTRDSVLAHRPHKTGALISIYGGKLTTHRTLAEEILALICRDAERDDRPWSATAPLHGGALTPAELDDWIAAMAPVHPDLPVARWARTYGSEAPALVERARDATLVGGVLQTELAYAAEIEDARSAEDFLTRRTKLALDLAPQQAAEIGRWFDDNIG